MVRNAIRYISLVAMLAALVLSSGCRRKVYENPIQKDTQQPDKVLYDSAIDDIEHGRYERARLTLQTLMNTYDTSEYLAKAKLAMADSWYREGGSRGYSQAEAEYKDFILFFKSMEEAAEAQMKICKMQFDQMDKSDRDPHHALRAQEECKDVLLEFPNSKFAVDAAQYLRDVQEVLADEEFRVQTFYWKKGSYPASANRGQALTDQFPLYSNAAEANWMLADSYQHLGDRFREPAGGGLRQDRAGIPVEPACRSRQTAPAGHGQAGSRRGSDRLCAGALRTGESPEARLPGEGLGSVQFSPGSAGGVADRQSFHGRTAAHHPGQRSALGQRHAGEQCHAGIRHAGRRRSARRGRGRSR